MSIFQQLFSANTILRRMLYVFKGYITIRNDEGQTATIVSVETQKINFAFTTLQSFPGG